MPEKVSANETALVGLPRVHTCAGKLEGPKSGLLTAVVAVAENALLGRRRRHCSYTIKLYIIIVCEFARALQKGKATRVWGFCSDDFAMRLRENKTLRSVRNRRMYYNII